MNYGQRFVTLYRRDGQDHPHGKEMQKSKMAVWGGLTNSCEKKRSEKQKQDQELTVAQTMNSLLPNSDLN